MEIIVTSGTGTGRTELGAFDNALWNAGVANYNLLKMSSILPPGTKIVLKKPVLKSEEYGHRLYVVLSERRESTPGKIACASLGWYLQQDGRGVLVEYNGNSVTEAKKKLIDTLQDLADTRGIKGVEFKTKIASIKCTGRPVCAIVAAIYQSQPW